MGAKERKAAHGKSVRTRDLPHVDPEELVLVTDEKNPLFDTRVLDAPSEELILNIMHYGPIEPVIVVRNSETGKYEVADGRGRVKATIEANKRIKNRGGEPWLIPFIAKRVDTGTSVGLMISLNEQRRDDSPLNRASKAARMLEHGKSHEDVGVAFGISVASVKNLVSLLDAPAVVRKAVESEKISVSDGYKLARLDVGEAKKKVGQLLEHAPRTPGKKRSANAKKAREIVDGPKAAPTDSDALVQRFAVGSVTTRVRSENTIENLLQELKEAESRPDAILALRWVLGDDAALDELGLPSKKGVDLYGKGEQLGTVVVSDYGDPTTGIFESTTSGSENR